MTFNQNRVVTVLLVSVLIAIASVTFLNEHYKGGNDSKKRSIWTEGIVEREVIADTAEWIMCFERIGVNQQELSRQESEEKLAVNKVLLDNGVPQDEIEVYNYVKEDRHYRHEDLNAPLRYKVGYFVRVKTNKLDLVTKLKNNIVVLLGADFGLVKNSLRVFYSKPNEINRELAKQAAQNALENAKSLAQSLNLKVKKIIKIEEPRFWNRADFPEAEAVNAVITKSALLGQSNAVNMSQSEENASESMRKQKMGASIRIQLSIK